MLETNTQIIDLDGKVTPIILAGIFGVNISLIYQEMQAGRLPPSVVDSTYRECIQMYVGHFKKSVDLKLLKESNEHELKLTKLEEANKLRQDREAAKAEEARNKLSKRSFGGDEGDDGGMHPLVSLKLTQNIKLNVVKERQIHQKLAIERNEYVKTTEMLNILAPFIQAIKNNLVDLASDNPEIQEQLDQSMESLYNLGTAVVEQAQEDRLNIVEVAMNTPLNEEAIRSGLGI
jgi:hypothetical protein